MQNGRRITRSIGRVDVDHLTEPIEQRPSDLDADTCPIGFADVVERPFDLTTQVPRDPIRSLRRVKRPLGRNRAGEPPLAAVKGGGTDADPVGTAYIGLAHAGGCDVVRWGWIGTRAEVMSRTAKVALNAVRLALLK